MKIKELIEKLQELDPELPVCVYDTRNYEPVEVLEVWVEEDRWYVDINNKIQDGKYLLI